MREEKRSHIKTQGLKRETRKGTISFSPTRLKNKKKIPN